MSNWKLERAQFKEASLLPAELVRPVGGNSSKKKVKKEWRVFCTFLWKERHCYSATTEALCLKWLEKELRWYASLYGDASWKPQGTGAAVKTNEHKAEKAMKKYRIQGPIH